MRARIEVAEGQRLDMREDIAAHVLEHELADARDRHRAVAQPELVQHDQRGEDHGEDAELADGVAAERGIRLLADVVLHLAGILHCDLCRNPKSLQHPGKNNVTLINLIGDLRPLLQKCHGTVTVHGNITILTKQLHSMTYTRFRYPKHRCNIYRTNSATLF